MDSKLVIYDNNFNIKNINSTSINVYQDTDNIYFNSLISPSTNIALTSSTGISIVNNDLTLKGLFSSSNLVLRNTSNVLFIDTVGNSNIITVSSLNTDINSNFIQDGAGPLVRIKKIVPEDSIWIDNIPDVIVKVNDNVYDTDSYASLFYRPNTINDYSAYSVVDLRIINIAFQSPYINKFTNMGGALWLASQQIHDQWHMITVNMALQISGGQAAIYILYSPYPPSGRTLKFLATANHVSVNSQVETHTMTAITQLYYGDRILVYLLAVSGPMTFNVHSYVLNIRSLRSNV